MSNSLQQGCRTSFSEQCRRIFTVSQPVLPLTIISNVEAGAISSVALSPERERTATSLDLCNCKACEANRYGGANRYGYSIDVARSTLIKLGGV